MGSCEGEGAVKGPALGVVPAPLLGAGSKEGDNAVSARGEGWNVGERGGSVVVRTPALQVPAAAVGLWAVVTICAP